MYFKLDKNKETKLWERILNGEFPLIEVIDLPLGKYQHIDLKTQQIGGSKCFEVEPLKFTTTLEELVMGNELEATKIFIFPPTKESQYWFKTVSLYSPETFEPFDKLVPYLRVAKLGLTSSQYDFEIHKFELKTKKKAMDKRKEHESEMLMIYNTTYRNRLLLLTI